MKIINTGLFYFGTDGTAYRGKIKLTQANFDRAIKHIMANKQVSKDYINGSGKYPYLSKKLLQADIKAGNGGLYALRVSATDYIVALFKNTSRYKYKKQNYIIQIIK
jgi:hypothetical protein